MASRMMPAVSRIARSSIWKRVEVEVVLLCVSDAQKPCSPGSHGNYLRKHLGDLRVGRLVAGDHRTLVTYGQIYERRQIPGSPTTYVVDRDGYLHGRPLIGPHSEEELTLPLEFLHALDRFRPKLWNRFFDERGRPRADRR